MGNICACTRRTKASKPSDSSCTLRGPNQSYYRTAPAPDSEHATVTSSPFLSAQSESIKQQIEHSKGHWSQLTDFDSDCDEVAELSNVEVFKALQKHPTWGTFFLTFNGNGRGSDRGELVMGQKFAEGGQAEIYEAEVKWDEPKMREWREEHPCEYVLKVFKKGTFLRHLQQQWPYGMLQFDAERLQLGLLGKPPPLMNTCDIICGTLLEDGRFAFLMVREHVDLRSLIDRNKWRVGEDCGPVSRDLADVIMYDVAMGMDWLHMRNTVHRDLKASNVHLRTDHGLWIFYVADFECSIGVVGTGFFRAPEILQACKDKTVNNRPDLFSKAADVYSYGMTCYEILTGKSPFEGHSIKDLDVVLNGRCPEVPHYVDGWMRELLIRCWHPNPAARPSFGDILNVLASNSGIVSAMKSERSRREFVQLGEFLAVTRESNPGTTGP